MGPHGSPLAGTDDGVACDADVCVDGAATDSEKGWFGPAWDWATGALEG